MKKWIKRILLLTICLALAIIPVFLILSQIDYFKQGNGPIIILIIISSITVLYYGIMIPLIIIQERKIKRNDRSQNWKSEI